MVVFMHIQYEHTIQANANTLLQQFNLRKKQKSLLNIGLTNSARVCAKFHKQNNMMANWLIVLQTEWWKQTLHTAGIALTLTLNMPIPCPYLLINR